MTGRQQGQEAIVEAGAHAEVRTHRIGLALTECPAKPIECA